MSPPGAARRLLWVLCRCLFIFVNNLYCIPAYVFWTAALRPLRRWRPEIYWRLEGFLFHWLLAMVAHWSDTAGYRIVEVGDEISPCCGERTLVLANHQSTGDVPVLMAALNARTGVLSRLMWIMDRLFRYTNFGIVSVLHGDFFIASGKDKREASARELSEHLKRWYLPIDRNWIVLFPEGGFLRKRRETSQKYAAKNNLPMLNHVSLPRVGALKVIIDEAGPKMPSSSPYSTVNSLETTNNSKKDTPTLGKNQPIETDLLNKNRLRWVLDITIGYENAKPIDLTDIVTGKRPPCTTHLHYRLFPSSEIPSDHEEMTKWLYDRFVEKESLLEYFYEKGCFPALCPDGITRDDQPKLINQDYIRFLFINLFFIASTIFQMRIFYVVYQYIVNIVGLIVT
ncbi:acyl-CoA:lysophosphatidylglycerol acyltransferase 1-like [Arctopsyche grandis]|uniref:acyl-CoA:lysophosphatidylglycerol acyltransferase 1-like n=1 Tax=Arctopsyche grandis TaxID=121162 RepID=UPI00406D7000